jgi:AcrR family transcriptional regulator
MQVAREVGHRERLLEAAIACLEEKGYARTTSRDLVAASGTNLASIGYHFGSKEGLLNVAMVEAFQRWLKPLVALAAEPGPATPLERLGAAAPLRGPARCDEGRIRRLPPGDRGDRPRRLRRGRGAPRGRCRGAGDADHRPLRRPHGPLAARPRGPAERRAPDRRRPERPRRPCLAVCRAGDRVAMTRCRARRRGRNVSGTRPRGPHDE